MIIVSFSLVAGVIMLVRTQKPRESVLSATTQEIETLPISTQVEPNLYEKNAVEYRLNELIEQGEMTVLEARELMQSDWLEIYHQMRD